MRLLTLFFLLSIIFLNAQDQKVDAIKIGSNNNNPCDQVIKGEVRDKATNELLPEAIITLSDKDGNPIETQMITEEGSFIFGVECNKGYILTATKESYTSQKKEFTTNNLADRTLMTTISLDKGRIDFIKSVASTETVDVSNLNTSIIAETSEVKSIPLTKEIVSFKEEVIEETKEEPSLEIDTTIKSIEVENIPLTKVVPLVKTVKNSENKDVLVLEPVFFEYESSYLTKKAKKELLKVVDVMKKHPNMIIEANSHTDAKGPENYNMWISERRAKRTIEYIIKRGINPNRISGKGYGELKLINDCTEGENCSDEQRAVNRRTEFVIIKK